jgi:hypothetical protein
MSTREGAPVRYRYANTWPKAIRIVEAGVLCDVRTPVTHRFPIEEAVRAFETSADPKSGGDKGADHESPPLGLGWVSLADIARPLAGIAPSRALHTASPASHTPRQHCMPFRWHRAPPRAVVQTGTRAAGARPSSTLSHAGRTTTEVWSRLLRSFPGALASHSRCPKVQGLPAKSG